MIAIAGYGFVGKAHYHIFKYANAVIVDPKYNDTKISDIKNLESVICCVSTPQSDNGECDFTNVVDVLTNTPAHIPVLVKSTISLKAWEYIKANFPNHTVNFSPEFLRANSAILDMEQLEYLIISHGGNENYWRELYSDVYPTLKFYTCSPEEAVIIKYFENAFLATKVSFFNQIYDFCNAHGVTYDSVREGLALDPRITGDHTLVNPAMGYRGWGGHCFPKDTAALLKMADETGVDLNILQTVVDYNKKLLTKTIL